MRLVTLARLYVRPLEVSTDGMADRRAGQACQPRGGTIAAIRAVFGSMPLSERRALAVKLDRLTARFAYAVMAAAVALFAYHGIRFAARIWGLA